MMSEENTSVYKEKLKDIRSTLKVVKKLMKSKKEETRLEAVSLFVQLSDIEIVLTEALKKKPQKRRAEDRNPLARRYRGEGGSIE